MDDINENGLSPDEQQVFDNLYGAEPGGAQPQKPGLFSRAWAGLSGPAHGAATEGLQLGQAATKLYQEGVVPELDTAEGIINLSRAAQGPVGSGMQYANPQALSDAFTDAPAEHAGEVAQNALESWRQRSDEYFRPNPLTTGLVGNALYGVTDAATRVTLDNMLAPGAGIGLAAASEGAERTQDLEAQHVDATTATEEGVLQGGAFLAMGEGGAIGHTFLQRAIAGVVSNEAFGAGATAADSALLRAHGYTQLADQEHWNDTASLIANGALGVFFAGLPHASEDLPSPHAISGAADTIDSALTQKNAAHVMETAPGIPTDVQSQRAHVDALDAAAQQLANGDDVYVAPIVRGMNTIPRPVSEGKAEGFAEALDGIQREADDADLLSGPLGRFPGERPVAIDAPNFGFRENHVLPEDHPLLQSHAQDESPERQTLRADLIEQRFDGHQPIGEGEQPLALVMGGGGGSGKGAVRPLLQEQGLVPPDAVELDPDDFKTGSTKRGTQGLPEYAQIAAQGDTRAAAATHAESDRLYQEALQRATGGRYNLVLDRTMSNPDKAEAELKALKDAGYRIVHVGVTVPVHEALARAAERSETEPEARLVPAPDLIKAHAGYSRGLGAGRLLPYTDAAYLYDNFVARGQKPKLVARGENGKLEVQDAERYNAFVEKQGVNRDATTFRDLYPAPDANPGDGSGMGPQGRGGPSERDGGTVGGGTEGRGRGTSSDQPSGSGTGPQNVATEQVNPAAGGVSASGADASIRSSDAAYGTPDRHPWVELDTTKNIPLAGGVSADGKTIYISPYMPKTVDVDGKTIDAEEGVVVHEVEEQKVMLPDGPKDAEYMAALKADIASEAEANPNSPKISNNDLKKVARGVPLPYPKAHAIATIRENAFIRKKYGIDPEKYQHALADGIEEARKKAAQDGNIPADLDRTPYEDTGLTKLLPNKPGGTLMQNRDRARAASLTQMAGIANAPDAQRLGFSRDPNTGAPMVSAENAGEAVPEADQGKEDVVIFADGRKVPVRYAVVDAEDVAASHRADGTVNPDYEGAPLQALNNGRVAGVQAAWTGGKADTYKAGLIADAGLFGIDPKAIADKAQPMVIRLYDAKANFGDMGKASNESGSLGLSPSEQALTDARALPDLDSLPLTESGDISNRADDPFHRAFLRNLGVNDAAKLVDSTGRFNKTYLDRLRAALFARAYGDPHLIEMQTEATDPVARNVLNGLTAAAPEWAKVDPSGPLGDYTGRLTAAMDLLRQARESGETVAQKLAQGDLIARDHRGDAWATFFAGNARSPKLIGEALRDAARMIVAEQRRLLNGDLLGGGGRDESDITKTVLKLAEDRYGHQQPAQSGSLFNAAGRPAAGARDAVRLAGDAQARPAADVARDRPGEPAEGERAAAGDAADGQPAATAQPEGGPARGAVADASNTDEAGSQDGTASEARPAEQGSAAPDSEGRAGTRAPSPGDRDVARAREAVARRPDLMLPEGLTAAEAMRQADEEVAQAERDAAALKAAVDCFLQFGSDAA